MLNFMQIENIFGKVIIGMRGAGNEPILLEIGDEEWSLIMRECPWMDQNEPTLHGLPLVRVDHPKHLKVCDSEQSKLRRTVEECHVKIEELQKAIINESNGLEAQIIHRKLLSDPHREKLIKEAVDCLARMSPPIYYNDADGKFWVYDPENNFSEKAKN